MREFRFILGKQALIVFLALLVATGALLGAPAATRTLAGSPPLGSQDVSAASAELATAEGPLLDPSGHWPFLQGGSSIGTWTQTNTTVDATTPPVYFGGHAMATTPSGVLLFGGQGSSGLLGDTWLFNTTTNTWGLLNTGSASPAARNLGAMATTPSGVLLFGGQGSSGLLGDTWLFTYDSSTKTGTWTETNTVESAITPRFGHAMASTPSGVLLFGGWDDSTNSADTWLFNTTSNTWGLLNTGSASPAARNLGTMAATPGGGVLLFGGWGGGYLGDTWLFNTASKSWALVTGLTTTPSARYYHAMAATPGGDVLLFGGYDNTTQFHDTWLFSPGEEPPTPSISVTSPTAGAHWQIGTERDITWTSTGLNSNTLTILLARDGVNFTELLASCVDAASSSWTWAVTGPGTINARICVQQNAIEEVFGPGPTSSRPFSSGSTQGDGGGTIDHSSVITNGSPEPDVIEGTSPEFVIGAAYPYSGTSTLNTSDPWLEISGGSGTGTIWVTPLDPSLTENPNLNLFIQETGKRSALFFDIGQEGFTPTTLLTVVLHYTPQLGEETFLLYRWNGTGWAPVSGIPLSPNTANHTFTFQVLASNLLGTPFALGGDPAAMPSLSPWALALLSLALLGTTGWWFLRRRRLA